MKEIWLVSDNQEYWNGDDEFGSREEAIKHGHKSLDIDVNESFWIGKRGEFVPEVDIDSILERVEEDAYEKVGEFADNHTFIKTKNVPALEAELNLVLQKHLEEPRFYLIEDAEYYDPNNRR